MKCKFCKKSKNTTMMKDGMGKLGMIPMLLGFSMLLFIRQFMAITFAWFFRF